MLSKDGRPAKDYLGARFYKCDLQMQTPFDAAHWVGETFETPDKAAEAYIRRCYEVGLEVIALTEHNFVSHQYIPLLQQKAKQLSHEFGYELVIFPGFEFTANIGRGVHVLAIFEPHADLNHIDHLLTSCGVPPTRQTSGGQHAPSVKRLDEIISVVQALAASGGLQGLVILPHIQSNSGLFDTARIAEWLQRQEFTNPDLLAVEVPKSPSKMNPAFKSLFGNSDDCQAEWKRTRAVCCIMSSDAKALRADDKTGNAIGSKFTWIKMSKPSIEALRQAFLDHDSRVRRSDESPERPELAYTHPTIDSIAVKDVKFLADKHISFSQNLTTIIGGRGTGKSTLVEYMRLALQKEGEIEADKRSQLFADLQNVRDTLALPGSSIRHVYNKGSDFGHQTVSLDVLDGQSKGMDSALGDIGTYLPVKFYSRGQIEAIANDPQKQASIIDDLVLAPLEALKNEERDVVRRLRDLNESLGQEQEISVSRSKLVADISNLVAQIEAIRGKPSSLEVWSKWNVERQYLEGLETAVAGHIAEAGKALPEKFDVYVPPDHMSLNADFLIKHRATMKDLLDTMSSDIAKAVEKAKDRFVAIIAGDERRAWQSVFTQIDEDNRANIKALEEMGVKFEAYDELFKRLETARAQLAQLEKRLAEIEENRAAFEELYRDKLLDIWERQFDLRRSMAARLNEQVTKTKVNTPTVSSEVIKHGDFKSFLDTMTPYNKDKRVVSPADLETMLKSAFDLANALRKSPIDVLLEWLQDNSNWKVPTGFPKDEVQPKKLEAVAKWFSEKDINYLRTQRIADAVTVSLHRREDGKRVGDLTGRKLSAGQKATTVLSLLLTEGTCPIVIDQPEDDLDNEFVFEQLVPML
ncbi:TrlF family AAA-like ATPase [Rhizobium sp. B209b/85]|nr:AAA family ATPase [Rhizobium sp. B209b/85]MBO9136462.1 hypothetical protein [Rhizobium sp. B209b/85]